MLPLRRLRSRSRAAACLLVLFLLPGCGNEPEPRPAPSPSPTGTPTAQTVEVFLGTGDPNDCSAVTSVERRVDGEPGLDKAMRALMAGPTQEEKGRGLGGWFGDPTREMLIGARVAGGVAEVDFKDLRTVIPNASSSCGSALLLAQLDGTAKQFDEVERTLYSIEGDATTFYEWLQRPVPDA